MLPLFFNRLHSYLVGLKRRTSRCFTCKRDNSYFLRNLKNPSIILLGIFLVLLYYFIYLFIIFFKNVINISKFHFKDTVFGYVNMNFFQGLNYLYLPLVFGHTDLNK